MFVVFKLDPDLEILDPAGSQPDPDILDPAGSGRIRISTGSTVSGSGSVPDPQNLPDIQPDPDLDLVHP